MPGTNQPDSMPMYRPTMERLHDTIGEAAEVAGTLQSRQVSSLVDSIHNAQTIASDLANRTSGGLLNLLSGPQRTIGTLRDKQIQRVAGKLSEVYELLGPLGVSPPSPDQLQYASQTGDYLGSASYLGRGPETDGGDTALSGECYPIKGGGGYVCPDGSISPTPIPPATTLPPGSTGGVPIQPPTSPTPIGGGGTGGYVAPIIPPTTPPNFIPPPPTTFPTLPPGTPTPITNPLPPPGSIIYPTPGTDIKPGGSTNPYQCPIGEVLYVDEFGVASCRKLSDIPPDSILTQPTLPHETPIYGPKPPEGETQPPGTGTVPPPTWSDDSCEWQMPSGIAKQGCMKIVPKQPETIYWVEAWCQPPCTACYIVYYGPTKPAGGNGQIYGPYIGGGHDLESIISGVCKQVVPLPGPDDEEQEEETPEDETAPDDEEEETPEDEEPVFDDSSGGDFDPIPAGQAPAFQNDDACSDIVALIGSILGEALKPHAGDKPGESVPSGLGDFAVSAGMFLARKGLTPADAFKDIMKLIEDTITAHTDIAGCNSGKYIPLALTQALLGFVQKWTGALPVAMETRLKYAINTVCQYLLPGGQAADLSFLRGTIDRKTWECYHKANGNQLFAADKVMMAGRAKLDPTQLDWLYRRKYINEETYKKLSREAGVMKDEDLKNIHDINNVWPSMSDTTRLMVRDVGDETNINWTKSDESFRDKYKGKMKDYFDALGVPEELARDFWRAHWHIPSFTMLIEMLHRLQSDMVSGDLHVTINDVKNALLQDDWHPDWVDRMIAMSYKVITRTDAIGAFMVYATTDEEFHKQLRKYGYTDDDATFFLGYYKQKRKITSLRRIGYPTGRSIVNAYANCELPESDFRYAISKIAISEEQENDAWEGAKLSRTMRERKQAINSVKRPFIKGIIDEGEAYEMLSQRQLDADCISGFIRDWSLLRLRQDKFLNAGQLCKMREHGIITPPEQLDALVRTGWSATDAFRIVAECGYELDEKARRRAETLAKQRAAELRRMEKEAEKARKAAECGPALCPANTPGGAMQRKANQQTQDQTTAAKEPNVPGDQSFPGSPASKPGPLPK